MNQTRGKDEYDDYKLLEERKDYTIVVNNRLAMFISLAISEQLFARNN